MKGYDHMLKLIVIDKERLLLLHYRYPCVTMKLICNLIFLGFLVVFASCSTQKLAQHRNAGIQLNFAYSQGDDYQNNGENIVADLAFSDEALTSQVLSVEQASKIKEAGIEQAKKSGVENIKKLSLWQQVKLAHKINKAIAKEIVSKKANGFPTQNEPQQEDKGAAVINVLSFVFGMLPLLLVLAGSALGSIGAIYPAAIFLVAIRGFLSWITAIILGIIGISKGGKYKGFGVAGLVLGLLEFFLILLLIAAVAALGR